MLDDDDDSDGYPMLGEIKDQRFRFVFDSVYGNIQGLTRA